MVESDKETHCGRDQTIQYINSEVDEIKQLSGRLHQEQYKHFAD